MSQTTLPVVPPAPCLTAWMVIGLAIAGLVYSISFVCLTPLVGIEAKAGRFILIQVFAVMPFLGFGLYIAAHRIRARMNGPSKLRRALAIFGQGGGVVLMLITWPYLFSLLQLIPSMGLLALYGV